MTMTRNYPSLRAPIFIGAKQSFLLKQFSNNVVKDCFVVSLLAMIVDIVSLRLCSD